MPRLGITKDIFKLAKFTSQMERNAGQKMGSSEEECRESLALAPLQLFCRIGEL